MLQLQGRNYHSAVPILQEENKIAPPAVGKEVGQTLTIQVGNYSIPGYVPQINFTPVSGARRAAVLSANFAPNVF